VAYRDLRILAFVRNVLGELAAALLGQRRHVQADHGAGRVRRQAEVGGEDRLLDRLHHVLLPRRDRQRARVGDGDVGDLADRHVGTVVTDLEVLDQRRAGAAGAQALQLVPEAVDALGHALLGVLLDLVEHGATPHDYARPRSIARPP